MPWQDMDACSFNSPHRIHSLSASLGLRLLFFDGLLYQQSVNSGRSVVHYPVDTFFKSAAQFSSLLQALVTSTMSAHTLFIRGHRERDRTGFMSNTMERSS